MPILIDKKEGHVEVFFAAECAGCGSNMNYNVETIAGMDNGWNNPPKIMITPCESCIEKLKNEIRDRFKIKGLY